ncbi:response regulator [Anabaena sp. FACHB-709]|uniref:Two-component response regulator n=2 Tax=Nostocaceae TaxID=1162 RepID=A0A1Z4KG11_ANAVA|nr:MULTISPECIES: response regulator [Nostocaceae]BAY67905.1 two-component response regulator [Trichormus variabilis NIES-23]HBW29654.1 response regulator [Nostoc sp. UBA8866]MBD2170004.1 response regulator [Anabaena cylindrica FACHB-318]MBD2261576.1 response regulator [Anabaena sp. FACHB-709]MBD2271160.1 response regulator [Nostoc sp. PCC 7120 = FACHB-418]
MTEYILFVDDEPLIKRLVTHYFRHKIRQGEYEFIFAHNGRDALEKLQANPQIDLLVTDINMPEIDGLTLLSKIRDLNLDIKAVIVSAYEDLKNIRRAMNQGAFDFITKPIDFQELESTMNRALEYVQEIKNKSSLVSSDQLPEVQSKEIYVNNQLVLEKQQEINHSTNLDYIDFQEIETGVNQLINHLRLYQQDFPLASPQILQNAKDIDLASLLLGLPTTIQSMKDKTNQP